MMIPSLDMVITRTHMLHDVGTLDLQPDLRLLGGDAGQGYHELFRRLMASVTDQEIHDPGPWNEPLDYTVYPELLVNQPLLVLGMLGIGPEAPTDCTVLGCDGLLAITGPMELIHDLTGAYRTGV